MELMPRLIKNFPLSTRLRSPHDSQGGDRYISIVAFWFPRGYVPCTILVRGNADRPLLKFRAGALPGEVRISPAASLAGNIFKIAASCQGCATLGLFILCWPHSTVLLLCNALN